MFHIASTINGQIYEISDGAKNYFYIADVDDRDYLVNLIKATLPALPKPKAKKNPTTNQ